MSLAFAESPLNWMINAQETIIKGLTRDPSKYQPWWTEFNHRYLYAVSLTYLWIKASHSPSEREFEALTELCKYTITAFLHFLRQVVGATHPVEMERLAELMSCLVQLCEAHSAGLGRAERK